jgi:ketol-acid reductoisomerase
MHAGLEGRIIAVVGFGHQGEAQALNLRDAGHRVVVGARPGRGAESRALAHGFDVRPPAGAVRAADVAAVLLPDEAVPGAWAGIVEAAAPACAFVFAHGFNLLYSDLAFGARADAVLVAPTAPGHALRATRVRGGSLPAYLAVHRDGSGAAWTLAEAWAADIGCAPTVHTSVREETEVDLFGEQAVLCGGMNALVTAAFDTLVDAGYAPEVAYLECVHQLRYLAESLHERGVSGSREGISGTALYGDLTRGPRVIGEATRAAMRTLLGEIRSGAFAAEWKAEDAAGRPRMAAALARARAHAVETARRKALGTGGEPVPGPE